MTDFKKGDLVKFSNNFGTHQGKIKCILPNSNGEKQVIIEQGYKQFVTWPISSLEAVQE